MSPEFEQLSERLTQLISSVSESLHREMHDGFRQMTERFDLMETRLNRHGALFNRNEWIVVEQRVRDLERKRNGDS